MQASALHLIDRTMGRVVAAILIAAPLAGQVETDPVAPAASRYLSAPSREEAPGFAWVEDSITAALDLPPLRKVSLPDGAREIRVWAGFGIVYPGDLLRLVQVGDSAHGEVYEWWDAREPWGSRSGGIGLEDIRRWSAERGCGELRVSTLAAACRHPENGVVDWTRVSARLDTLGAWDRAFPWPDPTSIDGVWVDVEVLRGDRYTAWGWDNPEPSATGDEGLVADVLALLREIQAWMR